jgi:hypothetical protein
MNKPLICPFCQQQNFCAKLAEQGCWCFSQAIPAALIALVPAETQNTQCICTQCVEFFNNDPVSFTQKYQIKI